MATYGRNDTDNGGSAQGQDPLFIRQCLQDLFSSQAEFPIKVEGTHTLPYASQVLGIEGEQALILKLIRPLPHELATGALFEVVFSAGEQRYQGLITYQKREAYLTYRFSLPTALVLSDRRRHKRYPFRPREKVDVVAQDAAVPGHGMTGPIVNLSMGGLAFRVDRIVRFDSGMRIPVSSAFFEKGKILPLLRIRNLPRVPLLDARGTIAHVKEINGEILLGVEFGDLTAENGAFLRQVIEIREKSFRTSAGPGSEPRLERPRPASGGRELAPPSPTTEQASKEDELASSLRTLQRRCRNLYLVGGTPMESRRLLDLLQGAGYFRTEVFPSSDELGRIPLAESSPPGVLVVALASDQETLQEIRKAQQSVGAWQGLPAVFLSDEPDPVAGLAEETSWRLLPMPAGEDPGLIESLDELFGIS